MLVSVIIPNYNYAEFLGQAIDSALGLDWDDVEVIVVDDGSTDSSREVMNAYSDRIISVFQSNGGQRLACNAGFERSRGEVVIFLDSDDVLEPSLIRELHQVWRPGISKVQFQMKIIDASGVETGSVLPHYDRIPTPAQVRQWASSAAAYPTPPGSGNAYSRECLARIFPLPPGDTAADSYCLAAAPYLGDVVTIAKPLVSYRIHGRNDGAMSKMDARRFSVELERACLRFRYAQRVARDNGIIVPDHVFDNSMSVLPYRLASYCMARERHPLKRDSRLSILRHITRASTVPQGRGLAARVSLVAWAWAVALSSGKPAEQLVLWRFSPSARPKALTRILKATRVLRSAPHR